MSEKAWLKNLLDDVRSPKCLPQKQLSFPFLNDFIEKINEFIEEPYTIIIGPEGDERLDIELAPWGINIALVLAFEVKNESPFNSHEYDVNPFGALFVDPRINYDYAEEASASPSFSMPKRRLYTRKLRVTPRAFATDIPPDEDILFQSTSIGQKEGATEEIILSVMQWVADLQVQYSGTLHKESLGAAARFLIDMSPHISPLSSEHAVERSTCFPGFSSMPWFVYEAVVNDPTGRVSQMVDFCPGLLIIAKGIRDLGNGTQCAQIFEAIQRGERLGRILDLAVELWFAFLSTSPYPRPWMDPSMNTRKKAQLQRQRIRHAGKLVSPRLLMSPFLPGFTAADIPRDPISNRKWYEITRNQLQRPFCADEEEQADQLLLFRQLSGLGSFLSSHWKVLDRQARERDYGWEILVQEFFDILYESGQWLSRRIDPLSVLQICRAWHNKMNILLVSEVFPDKVLSEATFNTWVSHDAMIRHLKTVGELIHVSLIMHHWIIHFLINQIVFDLGYLFFHAIIKGNPLMVIARHSNNGLENLDASGMCNRPATPEENEVLTAWLTDLREPPLSEASCIGRQDRTRPEGRFGEGPHQEYFSRNTRIDRRVHEAKALPTEWKREV
jgi:hypothetical protein